MSDKPQPGSVGENIRAGNARWSFAGDVAKNFSQHVRRSVPLYDTGHDLVCALSDYFVHDDSVCYEIGVSAGDLLHKLVTHNASKPRARFVGIDLEESMIEVAKERMAGAPNVSLEVADAVAYGFDKSDFIVSYYCIQFIPPRVRQNLINQIFETLNWGGAFVWFEKVRAPDARFQDISTALYTDFKLAQGYDAEEIVGKTRSLKGVLEPFSTQGNLDLLKRAGFVDVMSVMKYVCFEGFLAIK